jgi:hypothetical protein
MRDRRKQTVLGEKQTVPPDPVPDYKVNSSLLAVFSGPRIRAHPPSAKHLEPSWNREQTA